MSNFEGDHLLRSESNVIENVGLKIDFAAMRIDDSQVLERSNMNSVLHCLFAACLLFSPQDVTPTSSVERVASWQMHETMRLRSRFNKIDWEGIGPRLCGGRIECIATHPERPATMYVGVGSSGLWKTVNGGVTWKPIFENQPTMTMGAVAVSKSNPNTVWLGTGEVLLARSAMPGMGVFKSTDAGESWKFVGLPDTQHIARVIIHPTDEDTVYISAIGHQNSANEERGVFRTTDGGESWAKLLYVNDHTAAMDLAMAPDDPNTLYACMWERAVEGQEHFGAESGVYRTTDGGENWTRLAGGLPSGDNVGRIAVHVAPSNPKVVYALCDEGRKDGLYRSDDRGATWAKVNDKISGQWDWCEIQVSPDNEDEIYSISQKSYVSRDGGKNFKRVRGNVVHLVPQGATELHDDTHAIWINPNDSNHLMFGTDGGLYVTHDKCKNWLHLNNKPVAECYAITFDDAEPYNIYIGTQDNAALYGPHTHRPKDGQSDAWKYVFINSVGGGDCYFTYRDPTDYDVVYYEHQYGGMMRKHMKTGKTKSIQPKIDGEQLRFAWMTPFFPSRYEDRTWYAAANRVFKSTDRGDTWLPISENLVTDDAVRNLRYRAITTLRESPLKSGVLFAGTDNADLYVTTDDGSVWQSINEGLPKRFITRVYPSPHDPNRVFVSLSGAGVDDFTAYVFRSDDLGKTWKSIAEGLPTEPINVVYEDPLVSNLIYVGTDLGIYVSLDGGESWDSLCSNLPTTSVFDLFVHPKHQHLVIGTHGRSCFLTDVTPIHEAAAPASKGELEGIESSFKSTSTFFAPEKECELYSASNTERIDVTFKNKFDSSVELWWINYEGQRQSYGTVEPGKSKEQSTFSGHYWVVTDEKGEALFCLECESSGEIQLSRSAFESRPIPETTLPSRVDNSDRKYFPPVTKQRWNTCSQESAIHYIFAYEMNYQRNVNGHRRENQYPATWSWNFVNNGTDQGSEVVEGWHVASRMGVPSVVDYGVSESKGTSGWMSGYDRYYRSMKNRLKSWEFFKVTDEGGLEKAKRWLFNHDNPELSVGGLLAFDFPPSGHVTSRIPAGHYESGKTIVRSWGRGGGHLMTYVGYDDNVGFDFNGDGKITNDLDITGDGEVTIADWERGCFIMVNSWGEGFGQRGKAYVPYRSHFVQKNWSRGHWLASVQVDSHYQPRLTLRVNMSSSDRSAVRLRLAVVGGSGSRSNRVVEKFEPLLFSTDPILDKRKIAGPEGYSSFLSPGRATGKLPMRGREQSESIEMGFDASELLEALNATENGKLRLEFELDSKNESAVAEMTEASVLLYDREGNVQKTVPFKLNKAKISNSEGRSGQSRASISLDDLK